MKCCQSSAASKVVISVTRFGEISPLWQIIKKFGNIFKVYLVLGIFVRIFGAFEIKPFLTDQGH